MTRRSERRLPCVAFPGRKTAAAEAGQGHKRRPPARPPGHGKPSTASRSAAHSPASARPLDLPWSAATHEGSVGARCLHAARQPTPAPLRHAPLFTSDKLPVYIAALIANYARPSRLRLSAGVLALHTAPSVGCGNHSTLRWTNDVSKDAWSRSAAASSSGRDIITQVLGGQQINTAYVERDNLTSRQTNGRLVRKTLSHSKKLASAAPSRP